MSDRWKLGQYEFKVNPHSYSEETRFLNDVFKSIDGTIVHQPVSTTKSYRLSSLFFQLNPRYLYEIGLNNAHSIEFVNGKFHVLDKINNKIYRYSENLSVLEKTTTIPSLSSTDYVGFDAKYESSDYIYYLLSNATPQSYISKINSSGTTMSSNTVKINGVTFSGLKSEDGYIWIVTQGNKLYKCDINGNQHSYLDLPDISFLSTGYQGMTVQDGYLVLSYGSNDSSGCYHIDMWNGAIVNNFSIDKFNDAHDVALVGDKFVFLRRNEGTISYVRGNTVDLDVYILEKEIKRAGFVNLIDDMGINRKVTVSDYSVNRQEGFFKKYSVSISATKVDRGGY